MQHFPGDYYVAAETERGETVADTPNYRFLLAVAVISRVADVATLHFKCCRHRRARHKPCASASVPEIPSIALISTMWLIVAYRLLLFHFSPLWHLAVESEL